MKQINIYNEEQDLIEVLCDIDCMSACVVNKSGLLRLSYMRKDSPLVWTKDLHFGEYFTIH